MTRLKPGSAVKRGMVLFSWYVKRGKKGTVVGSGDRCLGRQHLDAHHSLPRSALHPSLSCCLPQSLAYRDPSCLRDFQLGSATGSPSQSLEEGRREAERFTPSAPSPAQSPGFIMGCLSPQPRLLVPLVGWSLSHGLSYVSSRDPVPFPSQALSLSSPSSPWA